jgi:hypothetical protein
MDYKVAQWISAQDNKDGLRRVQDERFALSLHSAQDKKDGLRRVQDERFAKADGLQSCTMDFGAGQQRWTAPSASCVSLFVRTMSIYAQ